MSVTASEPTEEELETYFDEIMDESESVELTLAEPIEVAKAYYVPDNRPVLYEPQETGD